MIFKDKKKTFVIIAVILLFSVSLGVAMAKKMQPRRAEVSNTATIPVETARVKVSPISASLSYAGTVFSNNDSSIAAKTLGRIISIPVREGDRVKKGDLLCIIDDSEYTGKINTLRQKVNTLDLNFKYLDQQLEKYNQLYNAGAVSEQSFLQYKLQRDVAASQLEEAKFSLRELEINLENAYVKAPFDGIVSSLQSQPGEMAVVGKPVLILSDTNLLKVQVKVTETDLKEIKEDMDVVLRSPLLKEILKSRVDKIYPSVDPQTRTTTVEIPLPIETLKPGTSIDVSFLTGSRDKALVVPDQSVIEVGESTYVFVVKDGKAVKRNVLTGIKNDSAVEITSGLSEEDEVIISNPAGVKDGKEVYVFKGEGGVQ